MSLKLSDNAIESHYESIVLKGWFMSSRVKLGATNSLGQTIP